MASDPSSCHLAHALNWGPGQTSDAHQVISGKLPQHLPGLWITSIGGKGKEGGQGRAGEGVTHRVLGCWVPDAWAPQLPPLEHAFTGFWGKGQQRVCLVCPWHSRTSTAGGHDTLLSR